MGPFENSQNPQRDESQRNRGEEQHGRIVPRDFAVGVPLAEIPDVKHAPLGRSPGVFQEAVVQGQTITRARAGKRPPNRPAPRAATAQSPGPASATAPRSPPESARAPPGSWSAWLRPTPNRRRRPTSTREAIPVPQTCHRDDGHEVHEADARFEGGQMRMAENSRHQDEGNCGDGSGLFPVPAARRPAAKEDGQREGGRRPDTGTRP